MQKRTCPVAGEFEQDVELARPQHFFDRRIHVAQYQAAAPLLRLAMDRHEIPERSRPSEADAREVDDHFRATAILQMGLVRGAQVLDRRRVEPEAVPELGDQDSVDVVSLERGLQHPTPAAGSGRNGHPETGSPEYRSTRSRGQAGRSSRAARDRRKPSSQSIQPDRP